MMQKFKSNLMYDNQLLFIIMIIRKKLSENVSYYLPFIFVTTFAHDKRLAEKRATRVICFFLFILMLTEAADDLMNCRLITFLVFLMFLNTSEDPL